MAPNRQSDRRNFNLDELNANTIDSSEFLKNGQPLGADILEGAQVFRVQSKADLASEGQAVEGDIGVVETDSSESSLVYVLRGQDETDLSNWEQLAELSQSLPELYDAATRFYVDGETGDDSNDGRSNRNAFATIGRAVEEVVSIRETEEGFDNRYVVQGDPQTMFTIKVAAGDYIVDNPVVVPDNVAILGDDLRNTRVFTKNDKADIFHVNSLNYIYGLRFKDHQAPSFAFAFPCANAEVELSGGEVVSANLIHSPKGYNSKPPIKVDKPRDPNGTKAELEVVMSNGEITGLNIVNPGSGYVDADEKPHVSIPAPVDRQPWITGSPYPLNCSSITGPFDVNGNKIPATLPLPYDTSEPGYDPITDQTFSDPVDIQGAGGGIIIDGRVCYGWNSMTEPTQSTDLPRSPLRSFTSAQFTQVNQGGPGFEMVNEGFAQFVSCFTTFCTTGYRAKGGGQGLISNSVSDFGNTGLEAQNYYSERYNSADIAEDKFSSVADVSVAVEGTGYSDPSVSLSGGNPSTVAQISARVENGQIKEILLDDPGAGYESAPSVVVSDPDRDASTNTDAEFTVQMDLVNSFEINNLEDFFQPGSGNNTRNPEQGSVFFINGEVYEISSWEELNNGNYLLEFFPGITTVSQGINIEMFARSNLNTGGHVFEYPGTGVTYNALPEYGGTTSLDKKTVEYGSGKVFHTSSDNQGNFNVGDSFRVNQQTGEVTIDSDQFNLSGLSSVGPFRVDGVLRGVQLREVSDRSDLTSNSGLPGNTAATINSIRSFFLDQNRVVPNGGSQGNVLVKTGSGDREFDWGSYSYNDLVDVPSEFNPSSHGNEAHDEAFLSDFEVQDSSTTVGNARTLNFDTELSVDSVSGGVANIVAAVEASNSITLTQNSVELKPGQSMELGRFTVPSNRVLKVLGGFVSDSNGSSVPEGTEIEVFNHTQDSTEYVLDGSEYSSDKDGLYTGSSGDDVEIRIVNATDADKTLTGGLLVDVSL